MSHGAHREVFSAAAVVGNHHESSDPWRAVARRIRSHGHLAGAVASFVIALATFVWRIERPMAWADEGVTYHVLLRSWPDLGQLWNGTDAPIYLYYVTAKAWTDAAVTLFGVPYSIAVIRLLSAVCMAVSVLFTYLLVSRHRGTVVALVAAGVLVAMPGVARYAQEARQYALFLALVSVSTWAFSRWVWPTVEHPATGAERPRFRASLGIASILTLSTALATLVNLYGVFTWGALGLAGLIFGVAPGGTTLATKLVSRLKAVAPLVVSALLATWPLLIMAGRGGGAPSIRPLTPDVFLLISSRLIFTDVSLVVYSPVAATVATLAMAVLMLASLAGVRCTRQSALTRFLWLLFIVYLVGSIGLAMHDAKFAQSRYWQPLLTPAAGLAALGAAELWNGVKGRHASPRRLWPRRVVVCLLGVAMILGFVPGQRGLRLSDGHGNDLRPVIAYVRALRKEHPNAVIAIDGTSAEFGFRVPARDIFNANFLLTPEPDSTRVWRRSVSTKQRMKALKSPALIWIHNDEQYPWPSWQKFPAQIEQAGLKLVSGKVQGRWRTSLYER